MFVNVRAASGVILDAVICQAIYGDVRPIEVVVVGPITRFRDYFFPRKKVVRMVSNPNTYGKTIYNPTGDFDHCFRFANDYNITCGPSANGYFAYMSSVLGSKEFFVEGSTRQEAILRCVALKLIGEVAQIPETIY